MNGNIRIAIVDDDVHIGDMMEEILKKEGYDVLRAYSGTEALLLLSGCRPDLILLVSCCRDSRAKRCFRIFQEYL